MSIEVTYDAQQPWTGGDPWAPVSYTPYVSIEVVPEYFGQKWLDVTHIVLEGVWPASAGNLDTFRADVLSLFSDGNGAVFELTGTGGTQTWDNTFVDSVNFPSQGEYNILKYNIILKAYDFPTRNSEYPILDPSDQVTVEENSNLTTTVTHTVSARGIDVAGTGNTIGISNAVGWVQARIALLPINNTALTAYGYNLLEETEDIDQFTQQFTVTRKYLTDPLNAGPTPLINRFSLNVTSTLQGDFDKAVIMCELRGGKEDSMADIRTKAAAELKESDMRNVIQSRLTNSETIDPEIPAGVNGRNFNLQCNDYSLEQSESTKTIKVKATFENGQTHNLSLYGAGDQLHYLDFEISVTTDVITGVTKVDVDAELILKGGILVRNLQMDRFLDSEDVQEILYDKAEESYVAARSPMLYQAFPINPESTDFQVTKNNKKGTLRMSASFNDESYIAEHIGGSWDVSIKTPVPVIKANPSGLIGTNGYWSMQSMDFCTREKISANFSIGIREDSSTLESDKAEELRGLAKTSVDLIFSQYGASGGCFANPAAFDLADGCYPISKTVTLNEGESSTIAHAEERSIHLGRPPLIDINLADQLSDPTCPSKSAEGVCGAH